MKRSGGVAEDPFYIHVRGYRVDLGDIEEALTAHPGVKNAAVFFHDEQLVAYVVSATASAETLRAHLTAHFNDWMVPSTIILMDEFPLTANGKIDRAALPAPVPLTIVYEAPQTAEEHALCAIVAEALRIDRVGLNDNFFSLGGDSLLALHLVGRIRTELSVELSAVSIFEHTTIGALARAIAERRQNSSEAVRDVPRRGPDAPPILFPTEPTSIPKEQIEAAVQQVLTAKGK